MTTEIQNTADSEYIREHLEPVLTKLLAELYLVKPKDPVGWLSNALRQYARQAERNGATALN